MSSADGSSGDEVEVSMNKPFSIGYPSLYCGVVVLYLA
eukprot:CAMPEP_0197612692 /NCGR_PEP_ID=MMETSP1326-20131121/57764_1 /TAXON_ID=1155430 /ORGANISM="Genus nov. species nov., Strain RCC2288" /LENGTH=37 /DNA_ID= /DNA_START= /DNA_END= /DNA_ORIENTATION=